MLSIKRAQARALEPIDTTGFTNYMVEHLHRHFPAHSSLLGTDQLHRFIHAGMQKAAGHGFSTGYETCLYIDIMAMLGSGFDTDPQLPWCASVLRNTAIANPEKRIEAVYQRALSYLATTIGKDEIFPVKALRRLLRVPLQDDPGLAPDPSATAALMSDLRDLWPAKARAIGQEALGELISQGFRRAALYQLNGAASGSYLVLMMFIFGHRVDEDPFFPWVSGLLNAEPGEQEKYVSLYQCVQENVRAGLADELVGF